MNGPIAVSSGRPIRLACCAEHRAGFRCGSVAYGEAGGECLAMIERLFVVLERLLRRLDVDVPVPQAVEALRDGQRVVDGAGRSQRAAKVVAGAAVVAPGPEEADVQ